MELQKSQFDGREGEVFNLQLIGEIPISLTLTKVGGPDDRILHQARELGIREPFNLIFCGPLEPLLEQQIYPLQHDELDGIDVFLVPVQQDVNGNYYEAVFG